MSASKEKIIAMLPSYILNKASIIKIKESKNAEPFLVKERKPLEEMDHYIQITLDLHRAEHFFKRMNEWNQYFNKRR